MRSDLAEIAALKKDVARRAARFAGDASGGAITTKTWMQHFIVQGLAAVEQMLDHPATGPFCHGDTLSLTDICLVPQI